MNLNEVFLKLSLNLIEVVSGQASGLLCEAEIKLDDGKTLGLLQASKLNLNFLSF